MADTKCSDCGGEATKTCVCVRCLDEAAKGQFTTCEKCRIKMEREHDALWGKRVVWKELIPEKATCQPDHAEQHIWEGFALAATAGLAGNYERQDAVGNYDHDLAKFACDVAIHADTMLEEWRKRWGKREP